MIQQTFRGTDAAATMRELTDAEIDQVAGGSYLQDLTFATLSGWSSAVIGAAAGSAFPVVGTVGGAVIGFAAGTLISTGFILATN